MWKATRLKNKHYTILKVLGRGKISQGIDVLLKDYNTNNPEIKKIMKKIYGK